MQYFVEPDKTNPTILARVDGLTVTERITPSNPEWTSVPSLASWAWDSTGIEISRDEAEQVAARWGASLP